jgi:nitroreductase
MFKDIVKANRSYRRFFETEQISKETLLSLVDLARLTPSGQNKQTLKYYLARSKESNEKIFKTLAWARDLKDWGGPPAGERPSAYIVICQDREYRMAGGVDHGITAQTILLGATEMGLGGCMLGNIKREELQDALDLPQQYEILLVVALGKPKETIVIDEIDPDGDITYWRDKDQVHHVPKRKLKDIVMNLDGV